MRSRWFSAIALLWLLGVPAAVQAGDAKKTPMVVVRVRSVDAVVDNVKLVVALAGRENVAQQIEGLIKAKIGPNGLEGIDSKRPFGGYARIGSDFNDVVGVAMIPIADEKAFLSLLENLNFKPARDKKGVYTVSERYEEYLSELMDYHEQENVMSHVKKHSLVKGDASKTVTKYMSEHPETLVAMAYFDMALYEPTKKCLEAIMPRLIKGSVLVFDELCHPDYPGETRAVLETLNLKEQSLQRSKYLVDRCFVVME